MSGLVDAVARVPLSTLSIIVICFLVQAYVFLLEPPVQNFTLCARNVIYYHEYYRLITGAVTHGGILHIGFNMMSTAAIGGGLETTLGTLGLAFVVGWSIVLCGLVYVFTMWALTMYTNDPSYLNQHAVGFSGVIFTLALLESHSSPRPTRAVFGLINVPTKVYPWVLLGVLQVMMPQVSFVGHLSGIFVGLLHASGITSPLLPSPASLQEIEEGLCCRPLTRLPNFIITPEPRETSAGPGSCRERLAASKQGVISCVMPVWWVLSAIPVILGLRSEGSTQSAAAARDDDDERDLLEALEAEGDW
ncbi:unnamed protein product [Chrysoparadoxa australica]